MRMNAAMRRRLAQTRFVLGRALSPRLAALCERGVALRDGGMFLGGERTVEREAALDLTQLEAEHNKVQMADHSDAERDAWLQEGFMFSLFLVAQLEGLGLKYRLVLSRDPEFGDVSVRFFGVRPGQDWGALDPEDYQLEEVIQWGC